jgi:Predicted periplasmic solute-binding protein
MDDIEKQGMTKHQILTLASIIDREAKYFDEMPRISGVYHNRLKKKMKLQADPTVQYALDEPRSRITAEDLKVESPYNTYKYAGLPPGPIGNPSKEAILAAIYPEQNEYLFFVSNTKGRHIFTKTYEEHKFYAKRYREWLDSLKISR